MTKIKPLARKFTDAAALDFARCFRYQFMIARAALDIPEFDLIKIEDRYIYHCSDMPVRQFLDKNGRAFAYLIGHAIDADGTALKEITKTSLDLTSEDFEARFESYIAKLSGRFVVYLYPGSEDERERIYPDAMASLGVIYDPKSQICASSLLLALSRDLEPNPHYNIPDEIYAFPEFAPLLPPKNEPWLPSNCGFGHSFDAHACLLLANHYLDLNDFAMRRIKMKSIHQNVLSVDEGAKRIVDRLQVIMRGLKESYEGYLAISGGHDSRMLMACAPDGFSEEFVYYSYANNYASSLDLMVAEKIANRLDEKFVSHVSETRRKGRFISRLKSQHAQRQYAVSSGLKGSGDLWLKKGFDTQLKRGSVWLRGNALELVTARFWPNKPGNGRYRRTLRHAMSRLSAATPETQDYFKKRDWLMAWGKTLPDGGRDIFMDYVYWELFLPHGQAGICGFNHLFYWAPACDRQVFETAMRVDHKMRKRGELYRAILAHSRPELVDFPTPRWAMNKAKRGDGITAHGLLEDALAYPSSG